jgi:hypothetical protein
MGFASASFVYTQMDGFYSALSTVLNSIHFGLGYLNICLGSSAPSSSRHNHRVPYLVALNPAGWIDRSMNAEIGELGPFYIPQYNFLVLPICICASCVSIRFCPVASVAFGGLQHPSA